MTDSNATYTRSIVCDLPDFPAGQITFDLLTFFAAAGNEALPLKSYTLTLDGSGLGTQVLPVPDNTGTAAWLWQIALPDGNKYIASLAYSASSLQLTAWIAAAVATATPNSLLDTFVLKAGDTMTGPLTFSGTDHAGVVVISLTTAQRDALTPAVGMIIHNSTTAQFEKYDGAWGALGGGAVDSVFGRTGAVVAAVSDYDANQVDVTPAGGIVSTDVQAALVELDSDIQSVAGSIVTNFNELFDTPASISANTLMWGGPLGGALVEKTAGESLTALGGQPANSKLSALAALTWAANSIVQLTGAATAAVVTLAAHVWTFLQSANVADARAAIGAASLRPVENEQTGTTYTLVLTDEDKIVQTTSASAVTITVPPNSSVAFPTGSVIGFEQYGAGTLSWAAGAGVTIRSLNGSLSMSGQYGSAALRKIGADEWLLVGALA